MATPTENLTQTLNIIKQYIDNKDEALQQTLEDLQNQLDEIGNNGDNGNGEGNGQDLQAIQEQVNSLLTCCNNMPNIASDIFAIDLTPA